MKPAYAIVLTIGYIVATGLFVTGCRQGRDPVKIVNPTGVYALVEVEGKALPAKISHEGATLEVRSGTLVMKDDGTCTSITVFLPPSGNEVKREVSATYTLNGSKLTMSWKGAGTTVGIVEGNTFTMNNEGMTFVYRK